MKNEMKKVLTIAGSDSGGGAGIQADLKTFAAFGVFGTNAITALTAQNTTGVKGIFSIPSSFVSEQIDAVMTDIAPKVWKTGMLGDDDIIKAICTKAEQYGIQKLVVDPVMIAKGGARLVSGKAVDSLVRNLIPISYIITPNCHEAEAIAGFTVKTIHEMKEAARAIFRMGAKHVVVKGGHSECAEAIDILYDGRTFTEFKSPRIDTKNTHGTGCTFASAIAASLAMNHSIRISVKMAKEYIDLAIREAVNLRIGKGHGPLNHFFRLHGL